MDHLSGRLLLLSLSSLQFRPFQDFAKDSPSSSLTLAQDSRLKIECSQISGHHYPLLCLTANCGVLSPFRLPETSISDISFTTSYASLFGGPKCQQRPTHFMMAVESHETETEVRRSHARNAAGITTLLKPVCATYSVQ